MIFYSLNCAAAAWNPKEGRIRYGFAFEDDRRDELDYAWTPEHVNFYTDTDIFLEMIGFDRAWIDKNGTDDRNKLIQYANALMQHYGQASGALSCKMYEATAGSHGRGTGCNGANSRNRRAAGI